LKKTDLQNQPNPGRRRQAVCGGVADGGGGSEDAIYDGGKETNCLTTGRMKPHKGGRKALPREGKSWVVYLNV
jgi:hypothetical protein